MNKAPYIIIGILLIGAVISIIMSSSKEPNFDLAQTENQNPPSPTQVPQSNILGEETQEIITASSAAIVTTKGEIVIELFPEAAPNTVSNFASKSTTGFYDNLTFHRVEDWVVQGGDPLGTGMGGGQIPTELNNNPFIRGSVGVARAGNIQVSNDAQFFITKIDSPHLDGQYTNFGQVSSGLEVVDSLEIGDKIISITIN